MFNRGYFTLGWVTCHIILLQNNMYNMFLFYNKNLLLAVKLSADFHQIVYVSKLQEIFLRPFAISIALTRKRTVFSVV